MSIAYLIANQIVFSPESNALNLLNSEKKMMLNAPTSRCLLLLLERQGEVISQRDFFEAVWGEASRNVPMHNLYQNISLLRKALTSLSMDDREWVITLPRKGFTLGKEIEVAEFEPVLLPPATPMVEVPAAAATEVVEIDCLPTHKSEKKMRLVWPMLFIALFSVLITVFLVPKALNAAPRMKPNQYFHLLKQENGCHYMVSPEFEAEMFSGTLQTFIPTQCQRYSWIYISANRLSPRVSIISCQNSLTGNLPVRCLSRQLTGIQHAPEKSS